MTPAALAEYLHHNIPLTRAMDITVLEASVDQVMLSAPLAPNLNMHGTMFGGSVGTLALTAAWSLLHLRLEQAGLAAQLVVRRAATEYLQPVSGTAEAISRANGMDWEGMLHMLERRGKSRVTVTADVRCNNVVAARLVGEFVAIKAR